MIKLNHTQSIKTNPKPNFRAVSQLEEQFIDTS